ncbi:MAG: DUF2934 domain-containing protein [Pseudomonadota bacterium]
MATSSKSSKASSKPAAKPASKAKPAATKATAKPAPAKAPAKSVSAVKVPAAKKVTPKAAAKVVAAVSPDQRRYYVEVAAYYIAERRGFNGGSQLEDWVQAEAEIDRLLREGILNPA